MAAETSRHVRLYGLQVSDDVLYARYREAMAPILQRYGGSFGYDFVVSKVLKSESQQPINRVFTIQFPDHEQAERFFANAEYLQARETFFGPSVSAVTSIASFEQPLPTPP